MNRHVVAASLAALLTTPAALVAQYPGRAEPSPRFRVTPFGAYAPALHRTEGWAFGAQRADVTARINGGPAGGVNLETALSGNIGVQLSATLGRRGTTRYEGTTTEEQFEFDIDGTNYVLARAGFVLFLHQQAALVIHRVSGSLYAGGALLHERLRDRLGTRQLLEESATHPGVYVGAGLEVPFSSDRLALSVGVEDNIMLWREEPLSHLAWQFFLQPEPRSEVSVGVDPSHMFLIRAGVTFRFR